MIGGEAEEHERADAEDNAPSPRRHTIIHFQSTRQHNERTTTNNRGATIKKTTKTNIESLLLVIKL